MNTNTRKLVYTALFTALVALATMAIKVPTPVGYVNIGDSMVFLSALLLGPTTGMIAGGLGSAIADILLAFGAWAPWTLVIKGIEGLIVGWAAHRRYKDSNTDKWLQTVILSCIIGGAWMVVGYWLSYSVITGSLAAGAVEIPFNAVQALVSIVLGTAVAAALRRHINRFGF